MLNKKHANRIHIRNSTEDRKENILSVVVKKEDMSCFRCNLFRVVTTFPSRDVSVLDSQADFYFKALGDRLCGAVRCRVYYLNSIPETGIAQKQNFARYVGSALLRIHKYAVYVNFCDIFFIYKK